MIPQRIPALLVLQFAIPAQDHLRPTVLVAIPLRTESTKLSLRVVSANRRLSKETKNCPAWLVNLLVSVVMDHLRTNVHPAQLALLGYSIVISIYAAALMDITSTSSAMLMLHVLHLA